MSPTTCDVFVGRAKPPANTATARTYGVVTVALMVERESGRIVAADVVMQSPLVCDFIGKLLVGRRLPLELPDMVRDIEERFHSISQRAVVQALHDASQKRTDQSKAPLLLTSSNATVGPPLRFAALTWGDSVYLEYGMRGASRSAAKLGASIDFFDCKFDPDAQARQLDEAMNSGRYDALLVCPLDATSITPAVKEAVSRGDFLVAVFNGPLDGRDLMRGEDLCTPGTVTFVGGQTHDVYVEWAKRAIEMAVAAYPDGGAVAAITGPKVGANSKNMADAIASLLPGTGLYLVANEETNYMYREGYQKAREILCRHPDLRFIFSNYSGMTEGIVRAIREAGLQNHVHIADFGGSRWALDAVMKGEVDMTAMMLPHVETQAALKAVYQHAAGKQVPRFIDLTKHPSLPGTAFVTRDNAAHFRAQFG